MVKAELFYNSRCFISFPKIPLTTDYGRPERKKPSLHGRKFTPTQKTGNAQEARNF